MKGPLVTSLALAGFCGIAVDAQAPSGKELISSATAYVHRFFDQFTNVVAEERYEQQTTVPKRTRILVSDFLLVKPPGDNLWHAYRDVAEVDGQPVRDREDRLVKLFLQPSSDTLRRAAEIREASARHNLADIGTLNNPLLGIAFLQSRYVDRFRFSLAGLDKELGPGVRKVQFVEFKRPTILRTDANRDLFSSGSIWIEEGTGRVVKTELDAGGQMAPARVATLFKFDEALGIDVPTAMEEWYSHRPGEFRGKATYGKFRRFEVRTEERIGKP